MEKHGETFLEACNAGIFSPELSFFSYEKSYARNPRHKYLYRYPFVYFLFNDNTLIYVGSTFGLPGRISMHMHNRYFKFDSILAVMFHQFGLTDHYVRWSEERCIRHFRPKNNIIHNPDYEKRGRKWVYLPELKEILNEEIQRV